MSSDRVVGHGEDEDKLIRELEEVLEKARRKVENAKRKGRKKTPEQLKKLAEASRRYYRKNHELVRRKGREEYQRNREYYRKKTKEYNSSIKGTVLRLYRDAKTRAEFYKLPFTITEAWIEERLVAGVCMATGLPFSDVLRSPWRPSLDQTIRRKGYTPENCKVVVCMYNYAKNRFTHDEVLQMARALLGMT